MRSASVRIGWMGRAGLLCLTWAIAFPTLIRTPGNNGTLILEVLELAVVLIDAEWVVADMNLVERWRRIACYAMTVLLLVFSIAMIAAAWTV